MSNMTNTYDHYYLSQLGRERNYRNKNVEKKNLLFVYAKSEPRKFQRIN